MSLESDCLVLSDNRGDVARTDIAADHPPHWITALAAVRARLANPACKSAAFDITLSESYYHLGLIRTGSDNVDTGELATIARHHFRPLLGEAASEHDYRAVLASAQTLLCCAIDMTGSTALREAIAQAGCVITSLRPRIATFAAVHAQALQSFTGHLIVSDAHTALLATLRNGAWLHAGMRRTDNSPGWLSTALAQTELLAASGGRIAWLAGHAHGVALDGWQVRRTNDFSAGPLA